MAGANERVVILNSSETSKYAGNQVSTTKYTVLTFLPKNLFEQFHRMANIYFLFIVILNWIPAINSFDKEISILPLLLVLSTTTIVINIMISASPPPLPAITITVTITIIKLP